MNKKHLDHDYAIGQKVLILKDGMLCKAEAGILDLGLLHKFTVMVLSGFNAEPCLNN